MKKAKQHPTGRLRTLRTGVERQRDHRASRDLASIDVTRETSDLIKLLRDPTSTNTNAVILRALKTLREQLTSEQALEQKRPSSGRDRRRASKERAASARSASAGGEVLLPASASAESAENKPTQKKFDRRCSSKKSPDRVGQGKLEFCFPLSDEP